MQSLFKYIYIESASTAVVPEGPAERHLSSLFLWWWGQAPKPPLARCARKFGLWVVVCGLWFTVYRCQDTNGRIEPHLDAASMHSVGGIFGAVAIMISIKSAHRANTVKSALVRTSWHLCNESTWKQNVGVGENENENEWKNEWMRVKKEIHRRYSNNLTTQPPLRTGYYLGKKHVWIKATVRFCSSVAWIPWLVSYSYCGLCMFLSNFAYKVSKSVRSSKTPNALSQIPLNFPSKEFSHYLPSSETTSHKSILPIHISTSLSFQLKTNRQYDYL